MGRDGTNLVKDGGSGQKVHIITKHADLQRALPKCQCCPAKVLQGARPSRLARGWTVRMTNATL